MAKAPRPGHVKTRLQGVLRPEEAATLGTAFLRDTAENLHAAALLASIDPVVAYAPAGQERRFDGLLPPGTALLLADGSGGQAEGVEGFGCVLLETMRGLFAQGYGAAVVLAADSPTLPTRVLAEAADGLLAGRSEAVLGAVEDGGYYLLGLRAPRPDAFARVRWSTDFAAADTRERLATAGLKCAELTPWFDVDDPAALSRLLTDQSGYAAPHTHSALAAMRLHERLHAA
ncbi:MAG: glycosyltransferase [Acetobacteraceae bacterium]|nr:glycosyltransferase [Acetobacteraceae bacterium]